MQEHHLYRQKIMKVGWISLGALLPHVSLGIGMSSLITYLLQKKFAQKKFQANI
jgi:hypothetical protein